MSNASIDKEGKMLNSIIKMDLHIHSFASNYKEYKYKNSEESIVEFSKIENIEVLLEKLLEHDISLFSITDHNRYDLDLYLALLDKLKLEKYHSLHLLHGIEFDVKLDEKKSTVHIIVIFNVENRNDMEKISDAVNENILSNKADFYKKESFETLLKKIGLDTLLIVHQRCNMNTQNGNHNSLSEGTKNPYEVIQVGYINALEYQKPNVEGIIKNNLKDFNSEIALVTGSDCHDWRYYPKHDKEATDRECYFSKCKILPTFKGLLLGLTSPKSRFNRKVIQNTNYLDSFQINGKTIKLDSGINVIIGENGSGKSTLFSLLGNDDSQAYIKKLKKVNNISIGRTDLQLKTVKQAELVEKFQHGDLFKENDYFAEIDTSPFENAYKKYSDDLKKCIQKNIQKEMKYDSLSDKNFQLKLEYQSKDTLYVNVENVNWSIDKNIHEDRETALNEILIKLKSECENDYYSSDLKAKLSTACTQIQEVYNEVLKKKKELDLQNKVKNSILGKVQDYNDNIKEISTSLDNEVLEYNSAKAEFAKSIVDAIKLNAIATEYPRQPAVIKGESKKRLNGYVFTRELNYNNVNYMDSFLVKMFVKDYQNLDKIKKIKTKNEWIAAILNCTREEEADKKWDTNYSNFIELAKQSKSYIKEESTDDSIGNTLGEMSLVYYKFQTKEENDWDVLMIDQPEDNISNNRIAEKLLKYFQSVRNNKQLILVTHNPLLVVNLDADNVIALNKVNNKIEVKSGCLEDEENGILNIVANTLDGGKDMIEKRLKIYGKNSDI